MGMPSGSYLRFLCMASQNEREQPNPWQGILNDAMSCDGDHDLLWLVMFDWYYWPIVECSNFAVSNITEHCPILSHIVPLCPRYIQLEVSWNGGPPESFILNLNRLFESVRSIINQPPWGFPWKPPWQGNSPATAAESVLAFARSIGAREIHLNRRTVIFGTWELPPRSSKSVEEMSVVKPFEKKPCYPNIQLIYLGPGVKLCRILSLTHHWTYHESSPKSDKITLNQDFPWISSKKRDFLWGFYGFLWVSMGFYGWSIPSGGFLPSRREEPCERAREVQLQQLAAREEIQVTLGWTLGYP